jgi:RNA polymerase sigma-70 factor, ECF subfamily
MSAEHESGRAAAALDDFDALYDAALPIVHGYLLRLCGGNADDAWDLTQETWVTVVRSLRSGAPTMPSVAWVLTVARSRWVDAWRRNERLERKLRLVWAAERGQDVGPARQDVLDHIAACSPAHRAVLMLAYIDDLPVADVARTIGSSVSTTYALLERARRELRTLITRDER